MDEVRGNRRASNSMEYLYADMDNQSHEGSAYSYNQMNNSQMNDSSDNESPNYRGGGGFNYADVGADNCILK